MAVLGRQIRCRAGGIRLQRCRDSFQRPPDKLALTYPPSKILPKTGGQRIATRQSQCGG